MYFVCTGVHVLSWNESREAVLRPLRYEETFMGFKRTSQSLGISRSDRRSATVVRALHGDTTARGTHSRTFTRVSIHSHGFLSHAGDGNTFGLTVDKAFPVLKDELMQQPNYLIILLLLT